MNRKELLSLIEEISLISDGKAIVFNLSNTEDSIHQFNRDLYLSEIVNIARCKGIQVRVTDNEVSLPFEIIVNIDSAMLKLEDESNINLAQTCDLEQIADIYDKSFETVTDIQKMAVNFRHIRRNPNYYALVEKEGSVVKGFAMLVVLEDIFENCNPYATLWSVCVAPEYRRHGVATKLLEQVDKVANERNCEFITLITGNSRTDAHALYRKNGYDLKKDLCGIKFFNLDSGDLENDN